MSRNEINRPGEHLGKFAVMRHRASTKNAKFCVLRDTREAAIEEAQRLSVEVIAKHGTAANFCFYVVEIVGRVGIIDGALQSS